MRRSASKEPRQRAGAFVCLQSAVTTPPLAQDSVCAAGCTKSEKGALQAGHRACSTADQTSPLLNLLSWIGLERIRRKAAGSSHKTSTCDKPRWQLWRNSHPSFFPLICRRIVEENHIKYSAVRNCHGSTSIEFSPEIDTSTLTYRAYFI